MIRHHYRLVMVLLTALLSGCVTTVEAPFQAKKSEAVAVERYVQLGKAYLQQGRLDRARSALTRAREIEPRSAEAIATLGLVYKKELEPELAEKHFREALSIDANYTRGRLFYSAFLYESGRFEDAYEQLTRASKDTAFVSRGQVFTNLGLAATRTGRIDEAIAAFEKALVLDRGQSQAIIGLASLYLQQERFRDAKSYYDQYTNLTRRQGRSQTPQTLAMGIELARHFDDLDQEASYLLLLRNNFPESPEYNKYIEPSQP